MRIKGGTKTRQRHKKILKENKGYVFARRRLYKVAKETYLHAGQYSYNDRKKRLSQMRSLWILRIGAALKKYGISYSRFINQLNRKNISLNRQVLSEFAIKHPSIFEKVVKFVVS